MKFKNEKVNEFFCLLGYIHFWQGLILILVGLVRVIITEHRERQIKKAMVYVNDPTTKKLIDKQAKEIVDRVLER